MLHRFLARARVWLRVVVWQVAVGACHAASVCWVSISVWTFAFRVRFVGILSAVEWSMKRERESARRRVACGALRLALCARIAPWSYRLWCLAVCLSQLPSPSSFLPFLSFCLCSFPFLCVLFSCRPRNFVDCDCDCVVFFSSLLFFLLSLALVLEAAIKNPSLMRLAPKHFEGSRICVLNPKLKPNDTERLRRHLSDWLF